MEFMLENVSELLPYSLLMQVYFFALSLYLREFGKEVLVGDSLQGKPAVRFYGSGGSSSDDEEKKKKRLKQLKKWALAALGLLTGIACAGFFITFYYDLRLTAALEMLKQYKIAHPQAELLPRNPFTNKPCELVGLDEAIHVVTINQGLAHNNFNLWKTLAVGSVVAFSIALYIFYQP